MRCIIWLSLSSFIIILHRTCAVFIQQGHQHPIPINCNKAATIQDLKQQIRYTLSISNPFTQIDVKFNGQAIIDQHNDNTLTELGIGSQAKLMLGIKTPTVSIKDMMIKTRSATYNYSVDITIGTNSFFNELRGKFEGCV